MRCKVNKIVGKNLCLVIFFLSSFFVFAQFVFYTGNMYRHFNVDIFNQMVSYPDTIISDLRSVFSVYVQDLEYRVFNEIILAVLNVSSLLMSFLFDKKIYKFLWVFVFVLMCGALFSVLVL